MRLYLSLLTNNITEALACMMIMSIATFAIAAENKSVTKRTVVKAAVGSRDGEIGYLRNSADDWVEPAAITVDTDGNIYIADIVNERIVKIDKYGKFKSNVTFDVPHKRYAGIVSDLATDLSGNLYVASRHEKKIFKYTSDGKPIFSINLEAEDICTSTREKKSRYDCGSYQFNLNLDRKGNIYLSGSNWVVKFDSKGKVLRKIAADASFNSMVYFIDESGNLYVEVNRDHWEKYDSKGVSLGPIKCTESFWGGLCGHNQYPMYPMFIDKNGFSYSMDYEKRTMVKKDIHGKYYGEYQMERDYGDNCLKFDENGNLYTLELDKNQFSIKKVSWN